MTFFPDGYDILTSVWLEPGERKKFERIVGKVLSGATSQRLVITGPCPSGKSSLLKIVRAVFENELTRTNLHAVEFDSLPLGNTTAKNTETTSFNRLARRTNVFATTNVLPFETEDMTIVHTTGHTIPRDEYDRFMGELAFSKKSLEKLGEHFVQQYISSRLHSK